MSYQTSTGISEEELSQLLNEASKKYGTFADGRVDYTNAEIAPIVMCTVLCANQILIVKRGYGLADAEGYWSTINGFIDQDKPVAEIAQQELLEELNLKVDASDIKVGKSYTLKNPLEKRSYIVFPCLVNLRSKPRVKLDREHTDFAWIDRKDLNNYHILDDLNKAVDSALELL